ncbi:alpha/beta hydrolase [Bacillus sp. V3-13]|uniref:alpha/beta hydrolase n=1 Tax=Bacillus sp. V3-13 TaxID=2053728 RepID=UPI00215305AA|nr:alpha/beta hydrolase [Bacillus sp. V3-13]
MNLVGNFFEADSKAVIIMCHGFTSDKSSRGRFDRFANTFQEQGYNALAFDFSGCGESDDDSLTLAKQIDDLKSAIKFVTEQDYSQIALYGHSFGSRVCLEAFDPENISTMILTGASTGPVKYNWDEHFSKLQLQELNETGYITEYQNGGSRKAVIIEKQMLLDFEQFNQEEVLKRITCPVLIIHGDEDWEEKLLAKNSRAGMKWLPAESQLTVIEGAGHSFMNHLSIIEQLSIDWLRKYFSIKK